MNKKLFDREHNYIICYHIRPDGDCIGCAFGLALLIQSLGGRARVIGQDAVPTNYQMLTDCFTPDEFEDETAVKVAVDSADPHRLGIYADLDYDICIDHHIDNSVKADVKIVDEHAASCAEMIFGLIKDDLPQDALKRKQICNLLYMGIVTDSDRFAHEDERKYFKVCGGAYRAWCGCVYHSSAIFRDEEPRIFRA